MRVRDIILFAFLCLTTTGSFAQSSWHTVWVTNYHLMGSGWTNTEIDFAIQDANKILAQCQIRIRRRNINSLVVSFGGSNGSVRLLSNTSPRYRLDEIELHKALPGGSTNQRLKVIFVGPIAEHPGALGVSRRSELHFGEIYENSVYMSNQLGLETSGQTLAHELGHILLNEGHYYEVPPNIMHHDHTRQNREFEQSQCLKMQKSLWKTKTPEND